MLTGSCLGERVSEVDGALEEIERGFPLERGSACGVNSRVDLHREPVERREL